MKHVAFLLLTLCHYVTPVATAQECLGFRIKAGATYELTTYNARDKPTGRIVYTFKGVRREGSATLVDVGMQVFDDKGKAQPESLIKYVCTGNELVADLSGMLQTSAQNPAFKDSELRIKTNSLIYPQTLSPGTSLKDGKFQSEMHSNGALMMEMDMDMTNRKVEGQQAITTPAGTFTTYKVSADLALNSRTMGIPIKASMRQVNYRTNDLLMDVRSETYSQSGKLMAYSILTKVLP